MKLNKFIEFAHHRLNKSIEKISKAKLKIKTYQQEKCTCRPLDGSGPCLRCSLINMAKAEIRNIEAKWNWKW